MEKWRSQVGDGKIKLLWLDDNYGGVDPGSKEYGPWFSLTCASGPEEMAELIPSLPAATNRQGYSIQGLPADVYLADFRLCDSKDRCQSKQHSQSGIHAPSAGFLICLLTGLRWPDHPQTIIPYSAYEREFGDIWTLCREHCPRAIHVLWDQSVTKGTRNVAQIFSLVAPQFRETLLTSVNEGIVNIPLRERDRLLKLCASGATCKATEQILTVGEFGWRSFLLGSMFHDLLEGEKHEPSKAHLRTSVLSEWLNKITAIDPIEEEARLLADSYFALRSDPMSVLVYKLIRQYRVAGKSDVSEVYSSPPPSFPWICAWNRGANGDQRVRLAILFLLVRAHAEKTPSTRMGTSNSGGLWQRVESLRSSYKDPKAAFEKLAEVAVSGNYGKGGENLLEKYNDFIERLAESGAVLKEIEDPFAMVLPPLPLSQTDVVQLLDPFPESWDATLSLDSSKKIGKGLFRLDPPLNLVSLLEGKVQVSKAQAGQARKGDTAALTEAEFDAVRRYAREFLPARDLWPQWLK
jgi:hypothetical protein